MSPMYMACDGVLCAKKRVNEQIEPKEPTDQQNEERQWGKIERYTLADNHGTSIANPQCFKFEGAAISLQAWVDASVPPMSSSK